MATNLFEVPVKYFDILTWYNYDLFHTEKAILCFLSNLACNMFFFHYLIKTVAREYVTKVANHTVTF